MADLGSLSIAYCNLVQKQICESLAVMLGITVLRADPLRATDVELRITFVGKAHPTVELYGTITGVK